MLKSTIVIFMENKSLYYAKELISYLEEYLKQPEASGPIDENWGIAFSRWMLRTFGKPQEADEHSGSEMTDILIGMYLSNLGNLLKKAQNRFVSSTPFATFMDFQFLYILSEHQEMTKSQLISANNLEMSSGIEVINRLKRSCWIQEKPNPEDRRAKLIYVSEKGNVVLAEYRQQGLDIYKSYSAAIDEAEKPSVLASLELLSEYNS